MITINTSNFKNKILKYKSNLIKKWNKVLYVYKNKMVLRAKNVHVYKNRTGNLTRNTRGFVKELSITLENKTDYASYVEERTKNKWLKNSALYYKKELERDLRRVK